MDEEILEILMAVEEGETTLDAISATTGRSPDETLDLLDRLKSVGFVTLDDPPSGQDFGGFHLSQSGRILLRLGTDEAFKRELAERLGGDADSAS